MEAKDTFTVCYAAHAYDGANLVQNRTFEVAISPWRDHTGAEPNLTVLVHREYALVVEIMLGIKPFAAELDVVRFKLDAPFKREELEKILGWIVVDIDNIREFQIKYFGDNQFSFEKLMNS